MEQFCITDGDLSTSQQMLGKPSRTGSMDQSDERASERTESESFGFEYTLRILGALHGKGSGPEPNPLNFIKFLRAGHL